MLNAWFVLEVETGLIDGWYSNPDEEKQDVLIYWDSVRPTYTHIIAEVELSDNSEIPDNRCLDAEQWTCLLESNEAVLH